MLGHSTLTELQYSIWKKAKNQYGRQSTKMWDINSYLLDQCPLLKQSSLQWNPAEKNQYPKCDLTQLK